MKAALKENGFWICDTDTAANRKLSQKLNEEYVEEDAAQDDDEEEGASQPAQVQTYDVEKILRSRVERASGERFYVVKWKDFDNTHNTEEPEEHLITNKLIISFWKAKKNKAQLERVTKLQEAALAELNAKEKRQARPLDPSTEFAPHQNATGSAAAGAAAAPQRFGRPLQSSCKAVYDCAHAALRGATVLVFDTETSGLGGCVLDLGWVLADSTGTELASYSKLWLLPPRERIHSRAFDAHRITAATLQREGVDPKPEILEFFALVSAALALGVVVAAHNASFDVGRLNHTAHRHNVAKFVPLRSALMLCTMHNATKHCRLRKKGSKALKPPKNEELYQYFFEHPPQGPLHRALPDCRVTLACYVKGHDLKWW